MFCYTGNQDTFTRSWSDSPKTYLVNDTAQDITISIRQGAVPFYTPRPYKEVIPAGGRYWLPSESAREAVDVWVSCPSGKEEYFTPVFGKTYYVSTLCRGNDYYYRG